MRSRALNSLGESHRLQQPDLAEGYWYEAEEVCRANDGMEMRAAARLRRIGSACLRHDPVAARQLLESFPEYGSLEAHRVLHGLFELAEPQCLEGSPEAGLRRVEPILAWSAHIASELTWVTALVRQAECLLALDRHDEALVALDAIVSNQLPIRHLGPEVEVLRAALS